MSSGLLWDTRVAEETKDAGLINAAKAKEVPSMLEISQVARYNYSKTTHCVFHTRDVVVGKEKKESKLKLSTNVVWAMPIVYCTTPGVGTLEVSLPKLLSALPVTKALGFKNAVKNEDRGAFTEALRAAKVSLLE